MDEFRERGSGENELLSYLSGSIKRVQDRRLTDNRRSQDHWLGRRDESPRTSIDGNYTTAPWLSGEVARRLSRDRSARSSIDIEYDGGGTIGNNIFRGESKWQQTSYRADQAAERRRVTVEAWNASPLAPPLESHRLAELRHINDDFHMRRRSSGHGSSDTRPSWAHIGSSSPAQQKQGQSNWDSLEDFRCDGEGGGEIATTFKEVVSDDLLEMVDVDLKMDFEVLG